MGKSHDLATMASDGFTFSGTVDASSGLTTPAGHIIQVVEKQDSTTATVSASSSWTNSGVSGLNLSITPKFSNSKILMTVHMQLECGSASNSGGIIFARDPSGTPTYFANSGTSSGLSGGGGPFNGSEGVSKIFLSQGYGGVNGQCTSHSGIDTPSTTSSVTYGVLWGTNSGTSYYNRGAGGYTLNSSITLMEIAQ